ncbi:cyclin-dependent kinase 7-like [Watersipora subatra]|uniref:cyclin-dependent kinase 7-like n=1 Tax=Watersipora subatra TaxID=2589382 RepID=UPI00355C7980
MESRSSKRYEKIEFLGEGQFATVYKAKDLQDNDTIVAVKKIKLGRRAEAADGINRTALREIKLLQELNHPNIISLRDVFGQKSNVSLVMDFMDTDLEIIIKDRSLILTAANVKSYILQTLLGCEYLHKCWILHRDLKPNNLLINRKGVLKLGDFGLAKFYGSPGKQYTHQVVTRWYRAPELLYGAKMYGTGVDIWACGCILAELLLRNPFLPGDTDIEQLSTIFKALGTPTSETWPTVSELPDYLEFKPIIATPLDQIFTAAGYDLLELLGSMLKLDPIRRCTATQALRMSYFSNKPGPSTGSELPLPRTSQEVTKELKQEHRAKRRKRNDIDDNDTSIKKLLKF